MGKPNPRIGEIILGDSDQFVLEHRCYNGVSLAAAIGCLSAVIVNAAIGIPLTATIATFLVGLSYLWLYYRGRSSAAYRPILWLYILNGVVLLTMTWQSNGGINGPVLFVSMVALVAVTVVMKNRRWPVVALVFVPLVSVFFLAEYVSPKWIVAYSSRQQLFLDVFHSFLLSTVVIFFIIALILQSYNHERARVAAANRRLAENNNALHRANADLEDALASVKRLSGLLPICASCKKIRDDQGYWRQVEAYIQKHSEAVFSHGICPVCAQEIYPDLLIRSTDTDA